MSVLKTNQIQTTGNKVILNSTGGIVDYQYAEFVSANDNYVAIGVNVVYDTPIQITYTPKSSTNLLIVTVQYQTRLIQAYGMRSGFKRDGAIVPGNFNGPNGYSFIYKENTTNHHYDVHMQARVVAGNTNSTTFRVWMQPWSNTGEYSQGWGFHFISVMEVVK